MTASEKRAAELAAQEAATEDTIAPTIAKGSKIVTVTVRNVRSQQFQSSHVTLSETFVVDEGDNKTAIKVAKRLDKETRELTGTAVADTIEGNQRATTRGIF